MPQSLARTKYKNPQTTTYSYLPFTTITIIPLSLYEVLTRLYEVLTRLHMYDSSASVINKITFKNLNLTVYTRNKSFTNKSSPTIINHGRNVSQLDEINAGWNNLNNYSTNHSFRQNNIYGMHSRNSKGVANSSKNWHLCRLRREDKGIKLKKEWTEIKGADEYTSPS